MLKSRSIFLRIFTLFTLCILQNANLSAQPPLFEYQQYISDGDTLLYRQLSPDYITSKRYPLVLFLHGSGERGIDNEAQLKWGAMNFADEKTMMIYPAYVSYCKYEKRIAPDKKVLEYSIAIRPSISGSTISMAVSVC